MLKRIISCCLALLCFALAAAAAEGSDEASLRQVLAGQAGAEPLRFFCADYDGDGANEAFAFVGSVDDSWGYDAYRGDLWFVNANGAQLLQQGLEYDVLEMLGTPPTMIFHADEYYGGSGSRMHTWIVENGAAAVAAAPASGDLEWAGGNDYYGYPSAFDMYDDGTGHTWKRYYFYMDGSALREYGGINISLEELLEFDGAEAILREKISEGYTIGDIFYRANGVINVNLEQYDWNSNISLRYDETSVSFWEEDGGVYLPASDPSIAVYPSEFRHPTGSGSAPGTAELLLSLQGAPTAEPAPITELPAVEGGYSCDFDLDGDGAQETVLLYRVAGTDEYGNEMADIHLRVTGADGDVRADGVIYSFFAGSNANQRYLLYNLGGGCVYVNAKYSWEGTSNNFEVFRMEGGGLIEEINLCDPDPSDGCQIYEAHSYEDVYVGNYSDKAGPAYIDALNRSFAPFGLSFVPDGFAAAAELPDSQLICDVTGEQIGSGGDYVPDEPDLPDMPVPEPVPEPSAVIPATAYVTGDVNMRDGPGLGYNSVTVVPGGSSVEYLGEETVDERGVTWYRIRFSGIEGWGSSKFVVLE